MVNRDGIILLHDNARPHVAGKTLKKLFDLKIETLPHPPYSPDLSPTDFHLFKHLELFLRVKIYKSRTEVESSFVDFIRSRKEEFYSKGINDLPKRWQRTIDSNGYYFD